MTWLLLTLSTAILVLAFLLRRHARKRLAALGLAGAVIYSDNDAVDEVLVSHRHGLTGKPDYISREGEELIPVERKSRSVSSSGAYEGEILQLAAYCLLVEERFGKPVRLGKILYQNRSPEIAFDDQLRSKLLDAIAELESAELMSDVARSHNSPARCRGCGFRQACRDSLACA
jgi:CRISPR-associated exonuclease Cas4